MTGEVRGIQRTFVHEGGYMIVYNFRNRVYNIVFEYNTGLWVQLALLFLYASMQHPEHVQFRRLIPS